MKDTLADVSVGSAVTVWYTVTRAGTATSETSDTATYDIGDEAPAPVKGNLRVMGARSGFSWISPYTLAALDADSLETTEAVWQYDGEAETTTARYFRDTAPQRLLHVSSGGETVTLNAHNVCYGLQTAACRLDAGSVVAWGAANNGGTVPADIAALTDIVSVTATRFSIAALRSDGSVVAWGNGDYGGTVPEDIAALTDIVMISISINRCCIRPCRRGSGKSANDLSNPFIKILSA